MTQPFPFPVRSTARPTSPDSLFSPADAKSRKPHIGGRRTTRTEAANSIGSSSSSGSSTAGGISKDPAFRALVASLDITRITDRVIACGLPWHKQSAQKSHKNNITDLALFLKTRYKDRYMIWNLTGDTSQGNYDTTPFNHQVVSFGLSKAYQLSLKTLFDVSRSMHAWLSLNPDNVCIVHCTNGILRSGIAIAAYLRYSEAFSDALTAFDYFISRRTPNDNTWPTVSQRRYLSYFNNTILVGGVLPTKVPLALDSIVVNGIPDFDAATGEGSRPGIEVYMNRKLVWSLVFSRHTKNPPITVDQIADTIEFQFGDPRGRTNDGLILDRDIQIRIFHCADPDEPGQNVASQQVVTMVNFSFNTGFMPPGLIRVGARDLDLNRRDVDEGRFVAGFSIDFLFEEAHGGGATAMATVNGARDDKGYAKFLDRSVSKCLARLISYHVVKVDETLMKGLEGMGIARLLACIALQKTNNDMKLAYEFYKSSLAPPPPPAPIPNAVSAVENGLSTASGSSTSSNANSGLSRRAPPTVVDLRQHTRQHLIQSPSALSPPVREQRTPGTALARSASSEGSRSGGGDGVRSSIQRLEGLIQKSAEAASGTGPIGARPAPPARRSSRSASANAAASSGREEDRAVESLVRELRERRERAAIAAAPPTSRTLANRSSEDNVTHWSRGGARNAVLDSIPTPNSNANSANMDDTDMFDYLDMYEGIDEVNEVESVPTRVPNDKSQSNVVIDSIGPTISEPSTKFPDPPLPPPEPSKRTNELQEEERIPVLTKMRESATARKSIIRKRQTLVWTDVEKDPEVVELKNQIKTAVGKDGKPVEVKKFEELFCFVPAESKSGSGPKLVQKAQFTTLLDIRRANVIAIGMSRFTRRNITGAQLAEAVNSLDKTKVSIDDLVQMKQLIPTENEARILNEYHNTPRSGSDLPLAPAELFMTELIKTDRDIGAHLEAFLFLQQMPIEVKDITELIESMTTMCTQFQTSSDLKVVLRTVYQLQQMSNDDLSGGNASFRPWMGKEAKMIGFKIDGLARLKDVKSADGNWSLMNLLVDLVNKSRPDVLDFTVKFHELKKIRQYDLRQMIAQLFLLEQNLKNIRVYQYKNATFAATLKPHLENAGTELAALRARFNVFQQAWNDAAEYFAEESEDYVLLPELFESVARNPDPNYNSKLSIAQQGNGTSVPDAPFGNRKQMTHLFVAMHVFLFGFEDSVKQNRRKVEEEARRLVREAAAAEERRRREEARAIKEGRMAPPPALPSQPYENPLLSSWREEDGASGASLKPSNAVRNRASVMLLQKKEVEAREMLARFSIMQRTDMTDAELQIRAQDMDEGDETDFDSSSQISHVRGDEEHVYGYESGDGGGYSGNGRRDSFQSVVSTMPVGMESGVNICHECFLPKTDCYCNW